MENTTKACPYCGEEILALAIKCKHCKSDLSVSPPGFPSGESRAGSLSTPPVQQFQKWEQTQSGTRARFVWLYGVLGFGVTCGVLFGWLFPKLFVPAFQNSMSSLAAADAASHNIPPEVSNAAMASATDNIGTVIFVLSMILFPIGGYIFGSVMWKTMDKKRQHS
jgi:hypothetical protein